MSFGTKLRVEHVRKTFQLNTAGGNGAGALLALDDVTFDVEDRELIALIGASGCGKSTLLKIIHGLLRPDHGAILVDGRQVTRPGFDRALVFQNAALLPWRTAQKNVELGLEAKGIPKKQRADIASACLRLVGLEGFENYYPHQLSGGMQQRVGLGRALAVDPEILLMDEPFGALDAQTRERLQQELLRVHGATNKTVVFVTHDLDEAVYLADRIVVLSARPGRVAGIIEVDLPRPRPPAAEVKSDPEFATRRREVWDLINVGGSAVRSEYQIRLPSQEG